MRLQISVLIQCKKDQEIKRNNYDSFRYLLEGSKGNKYTIRNDEGIWTCSCPGHGFGRGKDCKHIISIKNKN